MQRECDFHNSRSNEYFWKYVRGTSIQDLIDREWEFDDPSKTEKRFQRAVDLPSSPEDEAAVLEVTTQLARAQGLQRRFEQAHATLDRVEHALAAHHGDESLVAARVRCLLERGRIFNSSWDKGNALPLFEKAWQASLAASLDTLAVDAAHMIAIVSPPDQAMSWNLKAVGLAEQSSDPRARQWLASLHNNIGWTFHDQGDFSAALAHFQKALDLRAQQNKPRENRIAHWCVARALRSLGRVAEAIAIQQSLAADAQRSSNSDGYIAEELGECLLALDRPAEAAHHFAAAHHLLSQDPNLSANEPGRLQRLARLGARQA